MSAARSGSRSSSTSTWRLGLHLLDRVGGGLVVERGEDAGPVLRRQLVDDRGEVGRVELGEAGVRDAQLDRGDRRLERVHVLPVDVALRDARRRLRAMRPAGALEPEPPQQAGGADVDGDEVQRALDLVEAQVVDPDDLAAVDVDDLLVQQVAPEQDLVRALVELADVDGRSRRRAPRRRGASTDDHGRKIRAAVGRDDETGDGRVPVADGDDEIGDLADRLAVRVEHGPADRLAQVEHLPPRAVRRREVGRGPAGAAAHRGGGTDLESAAPGRRRYWVRSPLGERSSEAGLAAPGAPHSGGTRTQGPGRV